LTSFGGGPLKSIDLPPVYDSGNADELSVIRKGSDGDLNGLVENLRVKTKKKKKNSQLYMDRELKQKLLGQR
jgi:hypothetical protein